MREIDESGDGETDATRRYLHASDGRLIGWREGTNWHFVHADHLASTRLVTMPNASTGARMTAAAAPCQTETTSIFA